MGKVCRACANARNRKHRERHRDLLLARRREIYRMDAGAAHKAREAVRIERAPFRFSAQMMVNGVGDRVREHGLNFSPEMRSVAFVEAWLRRQRACDCCGMEMLIGQKFTGKASDLSPTFDRFDSARGYTLDNVRLICWRCNNIKRNYSAEDLRMVADWILNIRAEP